jgi:hypothetical protein
MNMANVIINLFGGMGLALILPLAVLTLVSIIFKIFRAK